MKKTYNLIVDTDPGTDDAIALSVASVYMHEEIKLLISSFGNVDGNQAYINLVNIANLLHLNSDVLKGSDRPMDKNAEVTFTDYHGANGLGGIELSNVTPSEKEIDFIDYLYNTIEINGFVKYVAIAPLTNLAALLTKYPGVVKYIDEVIIMGGGFNVFNMEGKTEFNFKMDPVATKIVMESGMKIKLLPLDTTHQLYLTLKDINEITGVSEEQLEANEITPFTLMSKLMYKNHESAVKHGLPGAIIHDVTTFLCLLDDMDYEMERRLVLIEKNGGIRHNEQGVGINIVKNMSVNQFKKILKEACFRLRAKYTI